MEPTDDDSTPQKEAGVRRSAGGARARQLAAIAGIAVLAALTVGWIRGRSRSSDDQYVVEAAAIGTVRKVASATGTIQPWTVVDIKSKAGGRVDELSVELGDRVRKGQVIARIDPSDSQLNVNTAKADIDGAVAKVSQSQATYALQISQSGIDIRNAEAQVSAAEAALAAAQARRRSAADQATSQPALTQAAIREAEAALRAAQRELESLTASQTNDRAAAKASADQAEATYKTALASAKRRRQLLAKGYVSQQDVDQQEESLSVAQAQLDAAREALRTLDGRQKATREAQDARVSQAEAQLQNAKGQTDVQVRRNALAESAASERQARAQLAQARETLSQANANRRNVDIRGFDIASAKATTARAKATLQNAADTLGQTTVRAPADGVVLQKYVEQGTIITSGMSMNSTGTSIVQIGEVSRLYVNVTVDETDIASVSQGQKVDVSVDAYPGVALQGTVKRISPRAEVEQNVTTVAVRVEIGDTSPVFKLLKPNMNATCQFIVGERSDVVTVPVEAIHSDDRGSYVEIASGGRPAVSSSVGTIVEVKVQRRGVTVGLEGSDLAEIKDGVQAGDRIVTQEIKSSAEATPASGSPISTKNAGPGGGGPPPGPPPSGGGK